MLVEMKHDPVGMSLSFKSGQHDFCLTMSRKDASILAQSIEQFLTRTPPTLDFTHGSPTEDTSSASSETEPDTEWNWIA